MRSGVDDVFEVKLVVHEGGKGTLGLCEMSEGVVLHLAVVMIVFRRAMSSLPSRLLESEKGILLLCL